MPLPATLRCSPLCQAGRRCGALFLLWSSQVVDRSSQAAGLPATHGHSLRPTIVIMPHVGTSPLFPLLCSRCPRALARAVCSAAWFAFFCPILALEYVNQVIGASWPHKCILVISRGIWRASPGSMRSLCCSRGGERGGGEGKDIEEEDGQGLRTGAPARRWLWQVRDTRKAL